MFDSHVWSPNPPSLRDIVEVADLFLKFAKTTDNRNALHFVCGTVSTILSAMKRGVRKTLNPTSSAEDQVLCEYVASVFTEHGKLWNHLNNVDKAKASYEKAQKWSTSALTSGQLQSVGKDKGVRRAASLPPEIFCLDVSVRLVRPKLPATDARIASTPQLIYCLTLLSTVKLSSHAVTLNEVGRSWLQTMAEDADEPERLRSLVGKLIAEFIHDDMKEPDVILEIVSLAPVLTQPHYRKLLDHFIGRLDQAKLLDFGLLDGLARLIKDAQGGHLLPADLVNILKDLSTRLQAMHQQSSTELYGLVRAVSNVLDAMAESGVKGLSREELHEPLSLYLKGLKDHSDLYLAYHAAYAYQALKYIPDNESSLQSILRRARVMVTGISGMVSAVKSLDLNKFLDGLVDIQEGFAGAYEIAKVGVEAVGAAIELFDSGVGLKDSLKKGLNFSNKSAWYPALRGSDTFIRNGELSKFKRLVCEAPCRRDSAFQLGVCQRLGEIAANPLWDISTRQQAVDFLCELYRNDAEWGKQASSKKWILTVLRRLTAVANTEVQEYSSAALKELESSGDDTRKKLYRAHIEEALVSFPLEAAPQTPQTSPLLTRAQNIPDVEEDLRKLRKRQLKDHIKAVYIPPRAKASRQASDSASFDLMSNMSDFLKGDLHVFLLLGDSGAGKSTFNRELERELWAKYNSNEDTIPLFIHLPSIDNPGKDLVAKHLRRCDFLEPQIRELKNTRRFTLVCDGYDECQQIHNLYTSNNLNGDGQWKAKMIISCRSEHLGHDYLDRFQPSIDAAKSIGDSQLQEAVIVPFSTELIKDYINRYVAVVNPPWRATSYLTALEKIPNLMDLIRNPFLLRLSLDVLPGFVDVDKTQNLSSITITRVELYDRFVEHWLERGKKRVGDQELTPQARAAFDTVVEEGFTANGIDFLKRLAAAIYKEQAGHPIVEYSRFKDGNTWKAEYFSRDDEIRLLRKACPLVRDGNQHRFMHKSLLEFCFSRAVFDPQENSTTPPGPSVTRRGSLSSVFSFDGEVTATRCDLITSHAVLNNPLEWRSFVEEPSIVQFLAERVLQESTFKEQLLTMIEHSKTDKGGRIAAANAITILVRAGVQFAEADLRGIRIPGADLNFGMFEGAQLQGADLRKVNFSNIWLRRADLRKSQMAGVRFGEWPYLKEDSKVGCSAYSPDGKSLAVGLYDGSIIVYDTRAWTKAHTLHGHTDVVWSVAYTPDGSRIASGSGDKTVRLWDSRTGEIVRAMEGCTEAVSAVVLSPSGHQLAASSYGGTVKLWDTQTGALVLRFAHGGSVYDLAYSASGHQLALGCDDRTVRLWDAQTATPALILTGHTSRVYRLVYSPNGHQIASGSYDSTVRLWDAQTGSLLRTLTGHSDMILSVAYSPSGHQIASGSQDKTVRLWDAQTGTPGPILTGHSGYVLTVSYSPNGHQIASGSGDCTTRLWDGRTGASSSVRRGHTGPVRCVAWSPSGIRIATASDDDTVRLWDACTGSSSLVLTEHTMPVLGVAYSPDGHHIASVSRDFSVRLWDAQSGASTTISTGHSHFIYCVVFSPSGHQLVTCSEDYTVRLCDVQAGASVLILTGHTEPVQSVAYSPTGHQLASGSEDKTVRLWDALTGAPLSVLTGHSWTISTVAYSPGGHQIASGSWDDTVRIWDVESGLCTLVLSGHTSVIWVVAYSSDGQRIASCGHDCTVRLWDAISGDCLTTMQDLNNPVYGLAWRDTDAGSYLATGSESGRVCMWRLTEKDGKPYFNLQWSSPHNSLNVEGAIVQDAHGLDRMQIQLLKQRDSVGEPIPPLSLRGAGKKLMSVAATVNRWSTAPKQKPLDDPADEPISGEAEPEVLQKGVEPAVEE
ncbi:unnamed protein product [Mortierella alpina]